MQLYLCLYNIAILDVLNVHDPPCTHIHNDIHRPAVISSYSINFIIMHSSLLM